jgi:hypothetical protein
MTTPGKNQSKRTPDRRDEGETEPMDERESVRNPGGEELEDDELKDEDEDEDRVPETSIEDQETGRATRDRSDRDRGREE